MGDRLGILSAVGITFGLSTLDIIRDDAIFEGVICNEIEIPGIIIS
jgi:hypothetical protein